MNTGLTLTDFDISMGGVALYAMLDTKKPIVVKVINSQPYAPLIMRS